MENLKSYDSAIHQLYLLEERVRFTGASLPEEDTNAVFHCVRCHTQDQHFLLDMYKVEEVYANKKCTPIPGSKFWIEGVINFRGNLLVVYNLGNYFKGEVVNSDSGALNNHIAVMRFENQLVAIQVDSVKGMERIRRNEFKVVNKETFADGEIEKFCSTKVNLHDEDWCLLDSDFLFTTLLNEHPETE